MGKPFLDGSPELLMLDTQNVINESVVSTVCTVDAIGRDQYDNYKSVIVESAHAQHMIWSRNTPYLCLEIQHPCKTKSKQAGHADLDAEE